MAAINRRVVIPDDHHLHLDLNIPGDIPVGDAELTVTIIPRKTQNKARAIECLLEIADRGDLRNGPDPAEWQREIRKDRSLPGRA